MDIINIGNDVQVKFTLKDIIYAERKDVKSLKCIFVLDKYLHKPDDCFTHIKNEPLPLYHNPTKYTTNNCEPLSYNVSPCNSYANCYINNKPHKDLCDYHKTYDCSISEDWNTNTPIFVTFPGIDLSKLGVYKLIIHALFFEDENDEHNIRNYSFEYKNVFQLVMNKGTNTNVLIDLTTKYISDADIDNKANIVEIADYAKLGERLPLKGVYVLYGRPMNHMRYMDVYDTLILDDAQEGDVTTCLVFCDYHYEDSVKGSVYYVFNASTGFFYKTFSGQNVDQSILRAFGEADATDKFSGLMSAEDKKKLDKAPEIVHVDSYLKGESKHGEILPKGVYFLNGAPAYMRKTDIFDGLLFDYPEDDDRYTDETTCLVFVDHWGSFVKSRMFYVFDENGRYVRYYNSNNVPERILRVFQQSVATQEERGMMSPEDKKKLDMIDIEAILKRLNALENGFIPNPDESIDWYIGDYALPWKDGDINDIDIKELIGNATVLLNGVIETTHNMEKNTLYIIVPKSLTIAECQFLSGGIVSNIKENLSVNSITFENREFVLYSYKFRLLTEDPIIVGVKLKLNTDKNV